MGGLILKQMDRILTVIYPNAHTRQYQIVPTDLNQVQSAAEFIDAIKVYKPKLEDVSKIEIADLELEDDFIYQFSTILHNIAENEGSLPIKGLSEDPEAQNFTLDLLSRDITLYKLDGSLAGSMHLDMMFDNWAQLFYTVEEGAPKMVVLQPTKMEIALTDIPRAYTLWKTAYIDHKITDPITIQYSGAGDSGSVDKIRKPGALRDLENPAYDALETALWDMIEQSDECGFYNNDGGFGSVEMDVDKFNWSHHNYITETVQSINEEVSL